MGVLEDIILLTPPERRREMSILAWMLLKCSGGLYVLCGPPDSGKSVMIEALMAQFIGRLSLSVTNSENGLKVSDSDIVVVARCRRPDLAPKALCEALRETVCDSKGRCQNARDVAEHVNGLCSLLCSKGSSGVTYHLRLLIILDHCTLAANDAWASLAALPRLLSSPSCVTTNSAVTVSCSVLVASRICPIDFEALFSPTVVPLSPYTRAQCVTIASSLYMSHVPFFAASDPDDPLANPRGVRSYIDLLASLFLIEEAPSIRTLLRLALQHEQLYRTSIHSAKEIAKKRRAQGIDLGRDPLLDGKARFTEICAKQNVSQRERTFQTLLAALPIKALHTLIACYLAAHLRPSQDAAFQNSGPSTSTRSLQVDKERTMLDDGDSRKKPKKKESKPRGSTNLRLVAMMPAAHPFELRRALFIQRHLFGNCASCTPQYESSGKSDLSLVQALSLYDSEHKEELKDDDDSGSADDGEQELTESERLVIMDDDSALFDFNTAVRELTRMSLLKSIPCSSSIIYTLSQRYECTASRTLVHEAGLALSPPLYLEEFIASN